MLQSLHHFDNTPFVTELEKRGFIVPEGSKSNYARTLVSWILIEHAISGSSHSPNWKILIYGEPLPAQFITAKP